MTWYGNDLSVRTASTMLSEGGTTPPSHATNEMTPAHSPPRGADSFDVRKAPWVQQGTELRFLLAGVAFYTCRFRALVLNAPFTHVTSDTTEIPPPPELPPGIGAARILACPMAKTSRAVTL